MLYEKNLDFPISEDWEALIALIPAEDLKKPLGGKSAMEDLSVQIAKSAYDKLSKEDRRMINKTAKYFEDTIAKFGHVSALEFLSKLGMFMVSNNIGLHE